MSVPNIIHESRGAITTIRIKDLANNNALSQSLSDELCSALTKLQADNNLRVVILTGEGEVFSTTLVETSPVSSLDARQKLFDLIFSFPVPVIAAVNGVAQGAGCELALACHLRLASSHASFSLPGTEPLTNDSFIQGLLSDAGQKDEIEVMLSGTSLSADEAYRTGLINAVSEPSTLLTDAETLADEIAQLAPLAVRACLRAVNEGCKLPLKKGLELETELFAKLFASNDMREGTRAFLEKRKPGFNGT